MANLGFLIAGMVIFFVVIIGIGVWFTKRANKDPEHFFLGNREFGPWVSALSAEASDMSGWLLMGLPGVAYFTGLGEAFWTAAGLAAGTYINWHITAKPLRIYSQVAGNAYTLPAYFSNRFHDSRRVLAVIAAVIISIFFSIYVGSQFVTFGKLFDLVAGSHQYYVPMIWVGAAIVFVYTITGGFLGQSFCDFVMSLFMIASIALVFIFALVQAGGPGQVIENLRNFPHFMDFFGVASPAVNAQGVQEVVNGVPSFGPGQSYSLLNVLSAMAWGLGYFGMPQVLVHFMGIRDPSKLKASKRIGVTWCFFSLFVAICIGMVGRAWRPDLLLTSGDSETIFINMAVTFFPALIAGLVLSGILAASMSSCDSYMLITSSSIANDIVKGFMQREVKGKTVLWISRGVILAVTLFGVLVATSGNDSIFGIVSYAWAGLGASFGPLMIFSLFYRRTTFQGAAAGMITGTVVVLLWKNVISKLGGPFAVYELLPAFIISCLVIWIVSMATKPNEAVQTEFDKVKAILKKGDEDMKKSLNVESD